MAPFDNSPEASFRGMIHDQNTKRWQDLESRLQPDVVVDGESLPIGRFRDHLLRDLVGDGDTKEVKIDAMLVDADTPSIAARLINRVTPAASEPLEYQEIVFANFAGSLLSTWQTVRDEDGCRNREPVVPPTPPSFSALPNRERSFSKPSAELKSFYQSYIKSINEKTMSREFDIFCQPVLRHNGRELTIAEYIPLISDSQDAIDGLHFDIQDLLADAETQQIAARLEFTGTPVKEWGGARPNGASVRFHEHVIYQLEQGKIARVWSTIELDLYRKQMGKDVV
ncbi:SnoaL-like polyketide cyclase [Colletotrichum graminicola]|uniref:SnoaL-like polyketide cyclase n=1 Tax=Colletotrichum graminicola (strain M1.001 / M2 / FGSC 10212) TaxID=645133 RepID=E3QKA2_COLGM|nr:SnoaL-like polyketide cyclase [Colletotrichum graminicola M1.001]EFQ31290.1 SnoaL-like polyketide cyclase [Colletotrichum graminicola M1.001]WDK19300.1 SnoaL-like polyketide cyclase [Colletotrichum graminicola]